MPQHKRGVRAAKDPIESLSQNRVVRITPLITIIVPVICAAEICSCKTTAENTRTIIGMRFTNTAARWGLTTARALEYHRFDKGERMHR